MVVHRRGGQQGWNSDSVSINASVRQDQDVVTLVDGAGGARAQVFKRSFHAFRTIRHLIADVGSEGLKGGVQEVLDVSDFLQVVI